MNSNTQVVLATCIPTCAALLSIFLRHRDLNQLRLDMIALRSEMRAVFAGIRNDITQFRDQIRSDLRTPSSQYKHSTNPDTKA